MPYPFEVWNDEHQRWDFYFDRWGQYLDNLEGGYPRSFNRQRFQIDLTFESDRLEDVWVHNWNPHHEIGNYHLSVYDCFYNSDNWSTIFEVYPFHWAHGLNTVGENTYRIIVEEGHQDPWGEPITLMSTSSNILDDRSHRYAKFRGKFYKVRLLNLAPRDTFFDLYFIPTVMTVPEWFVTMERWDMDWIWGRPPILDSSKVNWQKEGF